MTAKEALLTWSEGVSLSESQKLSEAVQKFTEIKDNPHASPSKIYYNIGTIQVSLADYESALENLRESLNRDPRLAVSYFRRGVILYMIERYTQAHDEFMSCCDYIRNGLVDYTQLGLKCKIFECEALYNAGVCMIRAGSRDGAVQAFTLAQKAQQATPEIKALTKKLDVDGALDKTKANLGGDLSVVDPVKDRLFTPSQAKVKNAGTKDYLGKAKVVSSVTDKDTFSGFVGPRKLESSSEPTTKPAVTKSEPPAQPGGHVATVTPPQPAVRSVPLLPAQSTSTGGNTPAPLVADSSSNNVRPALPNKAVPPRPVAGVPSTKPDVELSESRAPSRSSDVPAAESLRQACPQQPPPRRFASPAAAVAAVGNGDAEPGAGRSRDSGVAAQQQQEQQQQQQAPEPSSNNVPPVVLRPKKNQIGNSGNDANSSIKSRFINLELVIGEETEALCVKMETLDLLYRKIGEKLSCPPESFSLWYVDQAGAKAKIESDDTLQHLWTSSTPTGKAQLWCYARW